MSPKLKNASIIATGAMILSILASAGGSGAAAESLSPVTANQEPAPQIIIQPVETDTVLAPGTDSAEVQLPVTEPKAQSLAALVSAQPQPADLSRELNCLAGAIYFEAKSESLVGQLAVGRVVVARSKSGRFPESYCGVVFQRSQFSFVRGGTMPAIPKASRDWKEAVAIAQIAHAGTWQSPAEGALFFHAAYVSPGWRLKRLARIDNHVFYR
ncbi:cell wall hydrolase [Novosphingobium sp.]|uniref:cell wall hydrolase n=1 Tax=Novosphingobium sp. TaxID=1874826 RepID=UPI001EBD59ED|nr:cell wall hydrolase [Novosphingobium sp.]MBK6802908.1 cell wall hydrolase [Novosphingobium sp.]MBK9012244.1 cell wall hydrolase [Novosphingobium sp.]